MDNEHSKLGEHYKETFRDFRQEPSPAIWEKLAQHPALRPTPKPSWFSPAKLIIYAAAFTSVAVLFYIGLHKSPETAKSLIKTGEPALVTPAVLDNQAVTPDTKNLKNTTNVTTAAKINVVEKENLQQDKLTEKGVFTAKEKTLIKAETQLVLPTKPASASITPFVSPQITEIVKPVPHQNEEIPETTAQAPKSGSNLVEISPDTMICRGESSTIWASGGESYLWSTGETLASILVNPNITTVYSVTITDALGTQTNASVEIKVAVCQDLYVPNAFTPDGDNLNDEFIVKGENIQDFTMTIFSRNGQLVFETSDIHKGWDGKVRGKMGEPGFYTYKINYTDSIGKSHEKKGQLLLLR